MTGWTAVVVGYTLTALVWLGYLWLTRPPRKSRP
jgi:hypothetical protein